MKRWEEKRFFQRLIIIEILIALGILAVPLIRFGRLARFIDFLTFVWARDG